MHEFREPVRVLMGLGFPNTIGNVKRAYAVLVDWPTNQRGPAHEAAMNACRAALEENVDADTARSAFAEFARRAGILVESPMAIIGGADTKTEKFGAPS